MTIVLVHGWNTAPIMLPMLPVSLLFPSLAAIGNQSIGRCKLCETLFWDTHGVSNVAKIYLVIFALLITLTVQKRRKTETDNGWRKFQWPN